MGYYCMLITSDLLFPLSLYSEWTVTGAPLGLHDQRILAIAAEHRILDHGYDEYAEPDSSGTEFFRAAALTVSFLFPL